MNCPSCNAAVQLSSNFCEECGIEMPAVPDARAAALSMPAGAVACPVCQTGRDDPGSVFCGVCGYNFVTRQGGEVTADVAPTRTPAITPATPVITPATPATSMSGPRMDLVVTIDTGKTGAPKDIPPRTFLLTEEESLIGRKGGSTTQTVPLACDDAISRKHLVITRKADGSYTVRDIGSANGTRLNGKDLVQNADYPLNQGDVIHIGEWTVIAVATIRR